MGFVAARRTRSHVVGEGRIRRRRQGGAHPSPGGPLSTDLFLSLSASWDLWLLAGLMAVSPAWVEEEEKDREELICPPVALFLCRSISLSRPHGLCGRSPDSRPCRRRGGLVGDSVIWKDGEGRRRLGRRQGEPARPGRRQGAPQLAYQYARKGASLVLTARREKALKVVAEAARGEGSPDVLVIAADVSKQDESKRVIEEAIAHFGKLNHLVANAGILSSCLFEEITSISAFTQVMDVNFWGAVYPTYFAIPYLKNSRGNIIVMSSIAGRVPTARMSFYNASKGALIRFYETLRSELGTDVKITILTPGWVSSELTKGKFLQKGGEMKVNEEVRDVQVGFLPVALTEKCAEVVVDAACRGDHYVTWPSWYRMFHLLMCVAPEVMNWISQLLYVSKPGDASSLTLNQRVLDATGAKRFLYPSSIRNNETKANK